VNVLFVCLHNAGRSQISQALFERAAGPGHRARSAGTTPRDRVHPEVLAVMAEEKIDLSDRTPQLLTRELAEWADVVVTMGCGDSCPHIPGKRYIDWDLADPRGRPIDEVRSTRDDIGQRVHQLIRELDALCPAPIWRALIAEWMGSAFLAAIVVGSGIAAQQLSPGDVGLELLENAAATAAGLYAIILIFGPVSGAHFNPVVSFVDAAFGGLSWRTAAAYLPAQVAGCLAGAIAANVMYGHAAVSISTHHRVTGGHLLSEVVATLGLLLVIFALTRTRRGASAAAAVGAYIGAAYFFTSSASFANPAITVGRMFSNSFAGIAPASAPAYIVAQAVGGIVAIAAINALYPALTPADAAQIIVPHPLDANQPD